MVLVLDLISTPYLLQTGGLRYWSTYLLHSRSITYILRVLLYTMLSGGVTSWLLATDTPSNAIVNVRIYRYDIRGLDTGNATPYLLIRSS